MNQFYPWKRDMLVKVDENLPRSLVRMLCRHGHEAKHVVEQGMRGMDDSGLWSVVQSEGRMLITADKKLADIRLKPPGAHAGIILLRPSTNDPAEYDELQTVVLDEFELNTLRGTVTTATPSGVRVRRPDGEFGVSNI